MVAASTRQYSTPTQPRVPAGSQHGGRFAAEQRAEPAVTLLAEDAYGFPTISCPRCGGSGRSAYNEVARTNRCYHCNGTGRSYERGIVERAVRAFAAARMAATRPQVRQLRIGDTVSLKYDELRHAQWHKVAGVLVYPDRPTRFVGTGEEKRPSAYVAAVELDDGSAIMTTTDTVVARRGAGVDPTPYVEEARAGAVARAT